MKKEIYISKLNIGYENKLVIENINISSSLNKMIGLIGRNGTGKSTLLKTLSGLLKPLSGSIYLNSIDIITISEKEKAKLISIVLTKNIVIENISVEEYISYGRYPYSNFLGKNSEEDLTKIQNAIHFCNLDELKSRNYSELSDGEKQKVNIARAIAQDTPIIILDEPTAYLDLVNKLEVLKLCKKLVQEYNKTILISTHQIELAMQLCDEIWLINDKKIEVNTPKKIIDSNALKTLFNDPLINFNTSTLQ